MQALSAALSYDVYHLAFPFIAVVNFLEPIGKVAAAASKLIGLLP